jgi:TetR/AcrR family transcriptional repressor of nem operon
MPRPLKRKNPTRNLAETRTQILDATFFLVFSRGFQGVSIDDIVRRTQFTKGSLYHQFPTKMDLGYALVDEVIRPLILERWITPLDAFKNPLDGILSQMDKLIGGCPPELLKLGCPLNNLVQEMAPLDRVFGDKLHAALDLWVGQMARQLDRAKAEGYLKASVDSRETAHFVVMAHEGFYGMIKGLGGEGAFEALRASLKIYVDAISTGKRSAGRRQVLNRGRRPDSPHLV